MFKLILKDAQLVLKKDPATKTLWEALFFSPGVKALFYYRLAHYYYQRQRFLFARFLTHRGRKITGIEIHPGATIGEGLFIDHGMGVVIGETAIIGNHVTLFHGVTLGGIGRSQTDRKSVV